LLFLKVENFLKRDLYMKVLVLSIGILALSLTPGCRTTNEVSEIKAADPIDDNSDQVDPTGICTPDVNQFGFPSACDCPVNYIYDHTIGKCTTQTAGSLDPSGICTPDVNQFGFPSACDCPPNYIYQSTIGKCISQRVPQLNGAVPSTKVTGFDFKGLKVLVRAPDNQVCAAVVNEEEEACIKIGGVISRADGCKVLCSQPIAKVDKIAGYNFKGRRISDPLPAMTACPSVATEEGDACRAVKGKSKFEKGCKVMCSKPIAKKGKVAGFDFSGFKIADKLMPPNACPSVAHEEADSCLSVGGETTFTKSCNILCSFPITK